MLGLPRQVYMHPEDAVEFTPLEVPGLVGWWDFTDTSTMTVAVNGSGSAPTNGQAIGNIKNKATGAGKLGSYLKAVDTSEDDCDGCRPTWDAGGGQGFATFDGSNDRLHTDSPNSLIIDHHKFSAFAVIHADVEDISTNETIWSLGGTSAADADDYVIIDFRHSVAGSDGGTYEDKAVLQFVYEAVAQNNDLVSSAVLPASRVLSSQITGSGTGGVIYYRNGSAASLGGSGATFGGGSSIQFIKMGLSGDAFCIGDLVNDLGAPQGNNFDGKIHEIIIINQSVSNFTRDLLHTYLNAKHTIY